MIGNPTIADAILDRLVHNAYRIKLSGEKHAKTESRDHRPNKPWLDRETGSGQKPIRPRGTPIVRLQIRIASGKRLE